MRYENYTPREILSQDLTNQLVINSLQVYSKNAREIATRIKEKLPVRGSFPLIEQSHVTPEIRTEMLGIASKLESYLNPNENCKIYRVDLINGKEKDKLSLLIERRG